MTTISIVEPHEQLDALQLMLRHLPKDERNQRVQGTLEMIENGDIGEDCVLVAREQSHLAGAIVCIPLPGAGGICWPPAVVVCPHQRRLEDALVQAGLDSLKRSGSKIVQALLAPEEVELADPLLRNGFTHVTRLDYLSFSFSNTKLPKNDRSITLTKYDENRHAFEHALLRSFEQTLDCPELNGIRTVDEVMIGHHEYSDPERWWTAWRDGEPVGVLVLSALSTWEGWELSYVGVVPSARRTGIGRQLTAWALQHVHAARGVQLNLAVDSRNTPARNMYLHMGFHHKAHREVLLYFVQGKNQ